MSLRNLGYRLCGVARGYGRVFNYRLTKKVAPLPFFTIDATEGLATLTVHVDSTGTHDLDAKDSGLTFDWDWGDSTGHGSGVTATHAYTTPGAYTLTMTVTDADGNTAVYVKTVHAGANPTANFTVDHTSGAHPLAVVFTNTSSSTDASAVLAYDWNFGDATAHVATTSPSHSYANAGSFTATLTVTDQYGNTATHTQAITVS